jgi:glycosyltransferase involved in cell wall biosynthesis
MHRELPRHGFEPHLIVGRAATREGQIDVGPERVTVVDDLHRAIDPRADARAFRTVDRFVSAWRPDVVHTHMAKAGAVVRAAAFRRHVPVVVHTFHGHVLEGYFHPLVSRGFVQAERVLARRTDAILAVAPEIRDQLLDLGIGRPAQWHVVPVGVELDELLGDLPDPRVARERLGLPAEGSLVGIVGRLVSIKAVEVFLDAMARVCAGHDDVHLVVAGDGELRDELEREAARLLPGRVTFLGWVSDLPTLYAALDLVVLTSRNEGTPFSLIEAGASATPVVATQVGGVADVVVDGVTGDLVASGDAPAVAAAVTRLLDEPARGAAYGQAARAHVRDRFSAERLLGDLTALYDDLLMRKRPR